MEMFQYYHICPYLYYCFIYGSYIVLWFVVRCTNTTVRCRKTLLHAIYPSIRWMQFFQEPSANRDVELCNDYPYNQQKKAVMLQCFNTLENISYFLHQVGIFVLSNICLAEQSLNIVYQICSLDQVYYLHHIQQFGSH